MDSHEKFLYLLIKNEFASENELEIKVNHKLDMKYNEMKIGFTVLSKILAIDKVII